MIATSPAIGSRTVEPASAPDVIIPGHKHVKHEFVFVESPWLSREHLVVYPSKGPGTPLDVIPNERFELRSKYGPKLYYAAEADWPVDRTGLGFLQPLPLPVAELPIHPYGQRPKADPLSSALTTLRWVGLEGGKPHVVVVSHETFDREGNRLTLDEPEAGISQSVSEWPLIGTGVLGACLLLCLFFYRKRAAN